MPLSATSRHDLTAKLTEIGVSPTALDELMRSLPLSSDDAPVTRAQLEAASRASEARATERLARAEERFDEGIRRIDRDRLEERMSFQGVFTTITPMLLAFVAFFALLAFSIAVRTEKRLDRLSETTRVGAPPVGLTSTADAAALPALE